MGGVGVGSLGVQLAHSQPSESLPMTAELVFTSVYPSSCVCKAFISIDPHLNWSITCPPTRGDSLTFDQNAGTNIIIAFVYVSSYFLYTHVFSTRFVWKWTYAICAHTHSWPTLSIHVLFVLTDVRWKQRTVSGAIKSVGHTNMGCKRSGFAWLLSD